MKFSHLVLASAMTAVAKGFSPSLPQQRQVLQRRAFVTSVSQLPMSSDFGSDFGTAMPPKPELTTEEKLAQSATDFVSNLLERLDDGVAPPPELEALKEARDNGVDKMMMTQRIYELMIEQGMIYDEDPDTGKLSPTQFDIKNNLDVPEVKAEFAYLYKYGMTMISKGMLDVEVAKSIVQDRLIARTGLTPEKFDEWLGY